MRKSCGVINNVQLDHTWCLGIQVPNGVIKHQMVWSNKCVEINKCSHQIQSVCMCVTYIHLFVTDLRFEYFSVLNHSYVHCTFTFCKCGKNTIGEMQEWQRSNWSRRMRRRRRRSRVWCFWCTADVLQTIRSYCRFTCYHPHWWWKLRDMPGAW